MTFGLLLLGVITILYLLLVRGWLWKLILFFAGWFGVHYLLWHYVAGSHTTAAVFGNYHMSWASLVATFIATMALLTTKDH